jgi:hypothetical protein
MCQKQFRKGGEDMENTESGHPKMHRSDENVDKVQNTVYSDMVIWSTRLYYIEILARVCDAELKKALTLHQRPIPPS